MEIIITSIIAFASTNIDDIFILMLFFANKQYKARHVVAGQYLGIAALVAVSLVGSLIGLLFEQKYIGLLGLLPMYFGIRGLIQLRKNKEMKKHGEINVTPEQSNKTLSVAAVTFANGGDNIGIYIPFFATLSAPQKAFAVVIFLVMVAIWCYAATHLSNHRAIANAIDRYGHIITPIVLIILGVYILYESESFRLFNLM